MKKVKFDIKLIRYQLNAVDPNPTKWSFEDVCHMSRPVKCKNYMVGGVVIDENIEEYVRVKVTEGIGRPIPEILKDILVYVPKEFTIFDKLKGYSRCIELHYEDIVAMQDKEVA